MTSFRSKISSTKEDAAATPSSASQWKDRIGILGGRRSGKRRSPADSCVPASNSIAYIGGDPAPRQRKFGLRHLTSDSHINEQYIVPPTPPFSRNSVAPPSHTSEAPIYRSSGMAGILDMDRSKNRRDRTFVGSQCAVCDEPLEHTLRGERVLQFSCSHVSHEACFYEYIKEIDAQYCPECQAPLGLDSSRGGNVLDLGMRICPPAHRRDC